MLFARKVQGSVKLADVAQDPESNSVIHNVKLRQFTETHRPLSAVDLLEKFDLKIMKDNMIYRL